MILDHKLLIIDGPSAVGKSTVVNLLLKYQSPQFVIAKRVTTRAKRNSPEDNLSYDFVSKTDFENMIKNEDFLEYNHYLFGMSYGLPQKNVLKLLNEGRNVIGLINLGNVETVRKTLPNCFGVLIKASLSTIESRLRMRNIHTDEEINERLENAQKAIDLEKYYDLVITNEEISPEETVAMISKAFLEHQNKIQKEDKDKNDFRNSASILALYNSVQNDIVYYRGWEWNITIYYALLSTGIIGIVTNDKLKAHLLEWHLWGLTIIQGMAIVLGIFHLYKVHDYLSWNRKLRNRIEQLLGFFEKGVYFKEESVLPIRFNQRKSYFLFELKEFAFPFALVLIVYEVFTIYVIWNT